MNLQAVADSIAAGKWDTLKPLKNIDFNEGKFEANGETYFLETKLTIGRYVEYVILEDEMKKGVSTKEYFENLGKYKKLLDQLRFSDLAVMNDKAIHTTRQLSNREPTVLKICSLFINTEKEDRTTWGNDMVVKKLADWKKAGIDMQDFFAVALILLPGFIENYNNFTHAIISQLGDAQEIISAAITQK